MSTVDTFDATVQAIHCLRVNVKSLAAEAKIIRREELRCGSSYRPKLYWHRVGRLREESRVAQLALAFLRGMPYRQVESKAMARPSAKGIAAKITRFQYIPNAEDSVKHWLSQ